MSEPLLAVRDLHAWYGEGHALHGVNLEVLRGETVTLLGRNGVGKTTTLRAIMGLIRKRTGSVTFNGKDLIRLPLHRVAHQGIGFVPEERGIFATLTVDENLILPPVVAKGGMSVEEIFDLFPNLKERRNSQGTKLSGGEQQMLAIARILRTGVEMLLLDEPTEGIQPSIIKDIGRAIRYLRDQAGIAVLLVEQYLDFCRELADEVNIMDRGQIVHTGPAEDLDRPDVRKLLTV
ncbi:MAG: ABC transporter ATP-binding protein [Mesorhizobium sp.]|nr:MAG: ABC transporter ATP-binding protein [Mesorhizobium sp.]